MSSEQPQSLPEFLKQCQQRVNSNLSQQLTLNIPNKTLQSAMRYAVLEGGKRIRPVLTYGSAIAVGSELQAADAAAAAVELIHSYSLVHDDLPALDNDDLRRGKLTVHKAYDEAIAVLVGDALQTLAFQVISAEQQLLTPETQLRMVRLLGDAAGAAGMVEGQTLDYEAVGMDISLAQLEKMHSLKTGALIRSAVLLGGLSHDRVSKEQLAALEQYAIKIGLAFQVQDDILDETSDTETLGKPQGSDRHQNKPTYVSILGLDAARNKAAELSTQAIESLAGFSNKADYLRELASFVVRRTH